MKSSFLSATRYWLTGLGLLLAGCSSSMSSAPAPKVAFVSAQATPARAAAAIADMPATLASKAVAPRTTGYSVCAHVADWEQPEEGTHIRQLEALPRYGEAIHQPPLNAMLADFRSSQVISFTTYGLSARFEPLYLTGIWTAIDDMESCYSNGQPARISNGELGETWLIGYGVTNLIWSDGAYQLSVEPADGLQIVQFERHESLDILPMQVSTETGTPVEVIAGDWHE